MTGSAARLLALVALCTLAACGSHDASPSQPSESLAASAPARGDVDRGRALVALFQCNRCHEGGPLAAVPRAEHCVSCHRAILDGDHGVTAGLDVSAETWTRWRERLVGLDVAPSFVAVSRLEPSWVESFLRDPQDVRPQLHAMMPRLRLDDAQARDIAAFLALGGDATPSLRVTQRQITRGRALLESKACGGCHVFSGVLPLPTRPPAPTSTSVEQARALRLAPDLWFTRDRWAAGRVVEWLMQPRRLKPDTLMPDTHLSRDEATAITAYLFLAERGARTRPTIPARLPLLQRPVGFDEVNERVFRGECWHCHSDPSYAGGVGGPGNTGGFGFKGRGIDLSSYEGVNSGYRDAQGRRHSLFERDAQGVPRLVAVLRARQAEQAGQPVPGILGMPLGFPARSAEDIQRVESWIAQGRPR